MEQFWPWFLAEVEATDDESKPLSNNTLFAMLVYYSLNSAQHKNRHCLVSDPSVISDTICLPEAFVGLITVQAREDLEKEKWQSHCLQQCSGVSHSLAAVQWRQPLPLRLMTVFVKNNWRLKCKLPTVQGDYPTVGNGQQQPTNGILSI
jgi:hypothetical protein